MSLTAAATARRQEYENASPQPTRPVSVSTRTRQKSSAFQPPEPSFQPSAPEVNGIESGTASTAVIFTLLLLRLGVALLDAVNVGAVVALGAHIVGALLDPALVYAFGLVDQVMRYEDAPPHHERPERPPVAPHEPVGGVEREVDEDEGPEVQAEHGLSRQLRPGARDCDQAA